MVGPSVCLSKLKWSKGYTAMLSYRSTFTHGPCCIVDIPTEQSYSRLQLDAEFHLRRLGLYSAFHRLSVLQGIGIKGDLSIFEVIG